MAQVYSTFKENNLQWIIAQLCKPSFVSTCMNAGELLTSTRDVVPSGNGTEHNTVNTGDYLARPADTHQEG